MRVILEVCSGSYTGKKVELESGRPVRVGRSVQADLSLPEDSHLSGIHFVLECDESSCRLRDLKSTNGTLVNGSRVDAIALHNGAQIVAGATRFSVRVETMVPGAAAVSWSQPAEASPVSPPPAAVSAESATPLSESQERLIAMLRERFQPLFAILDAARDPMVLALLLQSKEEYQSLYEGAQGDALAQFAPYLVRLTQQSALLEKLVQEGWGKSWGVYLTCAKDFKETRRHFRHFLEVKLPDGREVYFRYYDPRVLRLFLPTCAPEEIDQFFGPVGCYLMEDEKPDVLLEFTNSGRGAEKTVLPLSAPEQPSTGMSPAQLSPTSEAAR